MRLTMRHYFDFGADRRLVGDDLVRPEAWDALRTQSEGAFALPRTRAELEELADSQPELAERARLLDRWFEQQEVRALASYGAGAALLEAWLLRLRPERRLVLTDYGPETVARLGALFPKLEVRAHDLLAEGPLAGVDLHLFHRIDTEFTDAQWGDLLGRFARERILLVATEVADIRRLLSELARRARRRNLTRAGWLRTRAAFEALWQPTHRSTPLRFHDLEAWVLEPRNESAEPA